MCKRNKKPTQKQLIAQLQDQITHLQDQVLELRKSYDKSFDKLLNKAVQADEMSDLLKNIKFYLKKANVVFDPTNGLYGVEMLIEPKISKTAIYVDNGTIIRNEYTYALAKLNLLSYKDMDQIQELLKQAKDRSKK